MGHTSGALAPRNSAGCVRRRQDAIFLFTFDREWSDPTPVGCLHNLEERVSERGTSQLRTSTGRHNPEGSNTCLFYSLFGSASGGIGDIVLVLPVESGSAAKPY